jgi:hypothetical protein
MTGKAKQVQRTYLLLMLLSAMAAGGCASQPRSYLALPVDAEGRLPSNPYVVERTNGRKHLAVVGALHSSDPRDPMYSQIESIFERVKPQLVLHESSAPRQVPDDRDQAIRTGGGIGLSAYLAKKHGAVLRSGDAPERDEFAALLRAYPAEVVLVFLTGQRFLGGYNPDLKSLAEEYPGFFSEYLVANGLPAQPGWDTWDGFLRAYESVMGSELSSTAWDPDLVSPIRDRGKLTDVARFASEYRDSRLLAAIRDGLAEHDRVVVVFGGWHVLALEPVIENP